MGDSNFFRGTVVDARSGTIHLEGLEATISVACDVGSAGQEVDVLIRPERIRLVEERGLTGDTVVEFEAEGTVNYGESVLAIGAVRGHPLRVRVAGSQASTVKEGAKVLAAWRPEDVHVIPVVGSGR